MERNKIILDKIEESVSIEILVYIFWGRKTFWKISVIGKFEAIFISVTIPVAVTMATLNQYWPRVKFTFRQDVSWPAAKRLFLDQLESLH